MGGWVYFDESEFECKCGCGRNNIDEVFVSMLDEARDISGVPFHINSGCRCPRHNEREGGVPGSAHIDGLAADIRCYRSTARYAIIKALLAVGFRRIKVYKSWIHVDLDTTKPQDIMALSSMGF